MFQVMGSIGKKREKLGHQNFEFDQKRKKHMRTTTFQVRLEENKTINNIWVFNLIEMKRKIKTFRFQFHWREKDENNQVSNLIGIEKGIETFGFQL